MKSVKNLIFLMAFTAVLGGVLWAALYLAG